MFTEGYFHGFIVALNAYYVIGCVAVVVLACFRYRSLLLGIMDFRYVR